MLEVTHLSKLFKNSQGETITALDDVSLTIRQGEVLGVVGESGCGKSTLGQSILRLTEPTSGTVVFNGIEVTSLGKKELKNIRRNMQIIFQDPFGSLNPRHRVKSIVGEPLKVHSSGSNDEIRERIDELLSLVGLSADAANRHPHEFSGGQRQRIAIARALALKPDFIVADEAVSALDVSVQSQIINLLLKLQKQLGLSMLFISHDLSVVRHLCDRIAVMYLGRIVETGTAEEIMQHPQHPYTQALISAIPNPNSSCDERIVLQGELPDPAHPPEGCAFSTRCSAVMNTCRQKRPKLTLREVCSQGQKSAAPTRHNNASGRQSACHLYLPI